MTVERNHVIAFSLVLAGFPIGSKNDEKLLHQLETRQVSLFNKQIILISKKPSVILVLVCVSAFHLTFSK